MKFVRGRRAALFRVVDGDAFDPWRSGLAIALCEVAEPGPGHHREEDRDLMAFLKSC